MLMPELPAGWTYEHTDLESQPHTRARSAAGRLTLWMLGRDEGAHAAVAATAAGLDAAIRDGLISARPAAHTAQPRQADMFADLRVPSSPRTHTRCKQHGSFYQPHCWHCTRHRPDRPHKRARQS